MTDNVKTAAAVTPPSGPQFGSRTTRPNVDAMTASTAPRAGVVEKPDSIRRKDIHDKWNKISDAEANGFAGKADLVAMINARYGTSTEQAQLDVDAWAKNRVF